MAETDEKQKSGEAQRGRVVVQLIFGLLQMVGATAGVALLLTTGVSRATVGMAVATGIITLLSRLIFHRRRKMSRQGRIGLL